MADRDAPDAGLLIDGARVPAASGATTPVRNPATGAVLAHVAQAGVADAHAAIEAAQRSYEVERPVYAEFVERYVERTRALRIGDPLDDATEIGSLISPEHRAKVDAYVRKGIEQGARLCIGGAIKHGGMYDVGSFYEPAVFADVTPDMVIAQEEIFGPVVSIMPFDSEEEAIRLANGSIYGLSGSLWTRDIGRALRVVRAVEIGVISVNTGWSVHMEMPFGGVKRSGVGRELGPSALEHYSEQKSVFIAED